MEKSRKKKWNLRVLIFLFSVISFYTSYTGLIKLAGIKEGDYIIQAFLAILVGGLQFALVLSINDFYIKDIFRKYWIKSIALLFVYIITMMLSVTFSFSYWYETFSAENYAQRSATIQLDKLKGSLIDAQESFKSMVNSLKELSIYSYNKSQEENSVGKTCNPRVGRGEGVYTWLRADDATITKEYANKINSLQSSLTNEIAGVSSFLDKFDAKGDVVSFNREVNEKIKSINVRFFQNSTLYDLQQKLKSRSGSNRNHIVVIHQKTNEHAIRPTLRGSSSTESCLDRSFTIKAKRVIKQIDLLKPVEPLTFFDMSDTKKLFGRTTKVLVAIFNPSYTIRKDKEIKNPDDIVYDDIYAVSAGFVIDFLILLITLIAKEPKEEIVSASVLKDILNGKFYSELLNGLNHFKAELYNSYLIAIPNDIEDDKIENIRLLMLYMQQNKIAKLYVNNKEAKYLNKYFEKSLIKEYQNSYFKIYKIKKSRFNQFILKSIQVGEHHV